MAWYDPTSWFDDSSSYSEFDPTYGGTQYDTGLMNVLTPEAYNDWQAYTPTADWFNYQPQQEVSSFDSWKGPLSLGLGGLSLLGNLYNQKQMLGMKEDEMELAERKLAEEAALAREKQRLGAGDDFSKMHALAQILQERQKINLNPSLAYAEAVRKEMGLSPASATPFTGDVGGPMRIQEQTAAKQAALQQALGQPVQYTAQFAGGGYYAGGGPNRGGALGLLRGGTGGQDDSINASISDGEYVMDAETVSMLGDGNTEAGAAKLDEMRQNLRSHKRSASPKKIAPKAKGALNYLKGK